ncbi:MAG: LysM peptidoglycan-binding domain-containing protein [Bacteroidota bacterium]|nr:LysM peptidoglycan-binding domain-containing protein [Bacteroidota bacterium]
MNRIFSLIIICLLCFNAAFAGEYAAKDSLGLEVKDGKDFILHKVETKETFYSISKRYNVSIEEIVNHNLDTKEGLKIDQVLYIPYKRPLRPAQNVVENNKPSLKGSIIHQVKPSETLFSISKQYNVKLEDVRNWNKLSGSELNVGQELQIVPANQSISEQQATAAVAPAAKANLEIAAEKKPVTETNDARVVHTVEPTQTLFSISRMYNISVEDLKKWNELEQVELKIGQKLIVQRKSEQEMLAEVKPEKKPDITANDKTVITEKFEDYEASTQRTSKAESEKAEKIKPSQTQTTSGGSKIVELGFAEVIEGTDDTKKFRALHKTAPVGTIIQVKNEMNNLSVFVRVLGTLPNTGTNDKTLIKITKAAYERLGAIDPRFPVEISYVP